MNTATNSDTTTARFSLGQLLYTPGAQETLQEYQVEPFDLLNRHVRGDWGDVCADDAQANEDALKNGARLLSAYVLPPSEGSSLSANAKIWIITEADRSVTTLLLPEEY
jgi:hypothetical protein